MVQHPAQVSAGSHFQMKPEGQGKRAVSLTPRELSGEGGLAATIFWEIQTP